MSTRFTRAGLDAAFPTFLKWSGGLLSIAAALMWLVTAIVAPPGIAPPAPLLVLFGTMFGGGLGTEAIRGVGKSDT